jgi:signal transduction histidine kinase
MELNATKDKFFSIIAHDLKDPFNAILGFGELLKENIRKFDLDKIEEFVNLMYSATEKGFKLLENLLEWSRLQTGRIKFNPTNLNINNIVDETIELFHRNATNKGIKVTFDVPEVLQVYADQYMIGTVLRNLLSNAIKFTPKGGSISVKCQKSDGLVHISVEDTGLGISKEDMDKIMIIDKSFSTRGTENERGTGLGLILCNEFLAKHESKLQVKSEEGKGSSFSFNLPVGRKFM